MPLHRARSDLPFNVGCATIAAGYLLLIVALFAADVSFVSWSDMRAALASRELTYSVGLSLVSCTLSAILSLAVAVPTGYLLSRWEYRGKGLCDALLDVPIVLPPLVVGLSLLLLFRTRLGLAVESASVSVLEFVGVNAALTWLGFAPIRGIKYEIPGVILAQFVVAAAFAIRTMRVSFDQIDPRQESVALTLGCGRGQAFRNVVLPQAWRGVVTAGTLAWARSMGEFGPILVFAGTTRMKTEVLSSSIYLELTVGNIEGAVAVSILLLAVSLALLVVARWFGTPRPML